MDSKLSDLNTKVDKIIALIKESSNSEEILEKLKELSATVIAIEKEIARNYLKEALNKKVDEGDTNLKQVVDIIKKHIGDI